MSAFLIFAGIPLSIYAYPSPEIANTRALIFANLAAKPPIRTLLIVTKWTISGVCFFKIKKILKNKVRRCKGFEEPLLKVTSYEIHEVMNGENLSIIFEPPK